MDIKFVTDNKIDKLSDDAVRICRLLELGRDNAKDRDYLTHASGMEDREVREAISQIRRKVPVICFGSGYFIPDETEDNLVNRWIEQESRRAKSIFWSMRGAKLRVLKP